jgi:hypothetical protein
MSNERYSVKVKQPSGPDIPLGSGCTELHDTTLSVLDDPSLTRVFRRDTWPRTHIQEQFALDLAPGYRLLCKRLKGFRAGVAQLAEHKLPKLGVAGSNPVARSSLEDTPSVKKASLFEVAVGLAYWQWQVHFD